MTGQLGVVDGDGVAGVRDVGSGRLPVTRGLTLAYALSLLIALLMAGLSVAALVAPAGIYPAEVLRQTFLANDVVNLAIGLPILLGAMVLARRGQVLGLLFWPGALMFVLYNYIASVIGMPVGWPFLLALVQVVLSAYTLVGLVASVDGPAVKQQLAGVVHERLAGGVLIALGGLMLLRAAGVVAGALLGGTEVAPTELPVLVSDFVLSPAWVVGGVLLWRRQALGYVSGAGLLFQTSMLFIGLVIFLVLQPALTGAVFDLGSVIVVGLMGLPCYVAFALFLRGALSKS